MSKVTYRVGHLPTGGEITVQIDNSSIFIHGDKQTNSELAIMQMVEFWEGYQIRMDANDGDWLNTFLKQLCEKVMTLAYENHYNLEGMQEAFSALEGWEPMDGSTGFLLEDFKMMKLDNQSKYSITELPF